MSQQKNNKNQPQILLEESFSQRQSRVEGSQDFKASLTVTLYDNQEYYYKVLEKGFNKQSFYKINNRDSELITVQDDFYSENNIEQEEDDMYTLKCTLQDIVYYPKSNFFQQKVINQKDLIGAEVVKGKQEDDLNFIRIVLYERQEPGCSEIFKRKRSELKFFHPDIEKLIIWKNLFLNITRDKFFLKNNQNQLSKKNMIPFEGILLVFINPASGPGGAKKIWKEAKKYLKIAGYQFQEIESQRQNYAKDMILDMDYQELKRYCGIVTVSGDGLPHEILQALSQRPDADQVMKIGVAPLPGGSGNAIARNIAYKSQETIDVFGATFNIIKGNKRNIDLLELEIKNSNDEIQKVQSCLSICCSYIADVDLNSEHLRCLGEARFDIYGAYRVFFQKSVKLKISYKIKDQNEQYGSNLNNSQNNQNKKYEYSPPNKNYLSKIDINDAQSNNNQTQLIQNSENWVTKQGNCKFLMIQNMPFLSTNNYNCPLVDFQDGTQDMQLLINSSWCSLLDQALSFQTGDQFQLEGQPKTTSKSLIHSMITEFIIESQDNQEDILFSVDGEKYEGFYVKGTVLPRKFAIFCN